jgi:hypothetical protein
MKKIIITIAALATLSTAALAERNYDISSPPYGETHLMTMSKGKAVTNVQLFAAPAAKKNVWVKDDASNDSSARQ